MAKKQYQTTALKKKKKKWISILSSKEFNKMEIGESLVAEPSSLIGKKLRLSLGTLTNKMRLQYISLIFLINDIKENKAITEITNYIMSPSYIKRIVKTGRSKLVSSFIVKCKDNVKVRVKPIIITKSKINRGILKQLRKDAIDLITKNIEKATYDENLNKLLTHSFQKELKENLKKITPLSVVEIRVFEKVK